MYGLNNNTGTTYSQQDNNFDRLGKKMTGTEASSRILAHIIKNMGKL